VSLALVRVDDRLLHGQVALGWGPGVHARVYLIADDRVAADSWERAAYEAAAPPGTRVEVWDLARLAARWRDLNGAEGTVILLRGLRELADLEKTGFRPPSGVNLGGLHASPGTRELLPFLHVTMDESAILARLLESGLGLYAQELPGRPRYDRDALLALLAAMEGGAAAGRTGSGAGR